MPPDAPSDPADEEYTEHDHGDRRHKHNAADPGCLPPEAAHGGVIRGFSGKTREPGAVHEIMNGAHGHDSRDEDNLRGQRVAEPALPHAPIAHLCPAVASQPEVD